MGGNLEKSWRNNKVSVDCLSVTVCVHVWHLAHGPLSSLKKTNFSFSENEKKKLTLYR